MTRNPTAVLHGTVPDKATRGIQYLAAKLAIVQDAKAAKKAGAVKISEAFHNAGILTKPLQGEGVVYKWGRLLRHEVTPPARQSGQARAADGGAPVSAVATAPAGLSRRPGLSRRLTPSSVLATSAAVGKGARERTRPPQATNPPTATASNCTTTHAGFSVIAFFLKR